MSLQFLLTGQLESMQDAGLDVVAISSPGIFLEKLEQEGMRTYGIAMLRHMSPMHDLRALVSLIRVLRIERPDIVHTHTPKAGLLGMLAAFFAGVSIRIHTYAGAPYDDTRGLSMALVKLADRVTALLATEVWSVGQELATFLEAERVVTRGRLDVLGNGSSNGVDLEEFFPAQRDGPNIPPRFIWIGRFAEDKGLEELAEMWSEIARQSCQATLEVVGDLDARNPSSTAVVERLRQDERVHFAGFRLDVAARLCAADVLLFTSRREGLPGVVLQAQACGVPVVTLRCRGVADALTDGVGGRIFERSALHEAARMAAEIGHNATLWNAYHTAGRRFVEEHFDRKAFHKELARRYYTLLSRDTVRRSSKVDSASHEHL
jgi:glycosyltransferase involved in cell wall biosynthesis